MLSTFANVASWLGMLLYILGIWVSERQQRVLFFVGSILLLFGAIGLQNKVLIVAQAIIFVPTIGRMLGALWQINTRITSGVAVVGLAVFANLGALGPQWAAAGAIGAIFLALGVATSPKRAGYLFFFLGGVLMTAYSIAILAIPWIILNVPWTFIALTALIRKKNS